MELEGWQSEEEGVAELELEGWVSSIEEAIESEKDLESVERSETPALDLQPNLTWRERSLGRWQSSGEEASDSDSRDGSGNGEPENEDWVAIVKVKKEEKEEKVDVGKAGRIKFQKSKIAHVRVGICVDCIQ